MKIQSITIPQIKNTTSKQPSFNGIQKCSGNFPHFIQTNYVQVLKVLHEIRPYRLGLNQTEINNLNKKEGVDFVKGALNFLCDKFWIPEEIKPTLKITKEINEPAGYSSALNRILMFPEYISQNSKPQLFGVVRHEFEHFLQTVQIMQHETFGSRFVKNLAEQLVSEKREQVFEVVQNPTRENMEKIAGDLHTCTMFSKIKILERQKNYGEIENLFYELYGTITEQINNFRENVIKRFGVIRNESPITSRIKKLFDEYTIHSYRQADGTVDMEQYYTHIKEQEALKAQARAKFEYTTKSCYVNYIKNAKDMNEISEFIDLQSFI